MVLDTEKRPRKSWVVWREQGKYPDVIVEILSDSTANIDRNNKKILYQNTFRTPNYFWFDPNSLELQGFRLIEGQYQAISPNDQGYLWSEQLGLYLGIFDRKLRYFTADGQLVPTPQEAELQSSLESKIKQFEEERTMPLMSNMELRGIERGKEIGKEIGELRGIERGKEIGKEIGALENARDFVLNLHFFRSTTSRDHECK